MVYHVLLFYKYTPIQEEHKFKEEQEAICTELQLTGRLRVAKEGINGNLGGTTTSINEYIRRLSKNPLGDFGDVDFKVSGIDPGTTRPAEEQKMRALNVKVTKELVSLGPGGHVDVVQHPGGKHLSPEEFHSMLTTDGVKEDVVLLDTRNIYETRIGQFDVPGVITVDPETRQFSDLPRRLKDPQLTDRLKGRKILMYCTGGVRCERASALIQSHGAGFDQVYQLSGGIHRYVEKYGAQGCFKGKNFVFDDRMSTLANDQVCGKCAVCSVPFDDYTVGCRCSRCRLRILVCDACNAAEPEVHRVCELCTLHANEERTSFGLSNVTTPRRVTHVGNIICFHDVSGSKKSCASALRRIAAKLQHHALFRYVESSLCLDEDLNTNGFDIAASKTSNVRPRLTWFGDTTASPTATRRRKKHEVMDCMLHLLDIVMEAWPFDGVLGIGEGARAASVVTMLISMGDESFHQFFNTLATSPRLSDATSKKIVNEETAAHVARVERQRAFFASARAAEGGRLMYAILINGQMTMELGGFQLLNIIPRAEAMVPSLHLNVRTRQHRIVGGLAPPMSSTEQERQCQELHTLYQSYGAPTTLVTPDLISQEQDHSTTSTVAGSDGTQGSRRGQKRRKLKDGDCVTSSSNVKLGVYDEQPGVSIRNFACIEALRSFLHRCSLHKTS